MKNSFKLLLLSLFISMSMNGQFKFGAQIGLNGSSVNETISNDYENFAFPAKTKLGINLGLSVFYTLNEEISLQSGLFYSNKGYNVDMEELQKKFDTGTITGKWHYDYNYLELPINFTYHFNDFEIYTGPYLAYALSGKALVDITIKDGSTTETYKETETLVPVTGSVKPEDAISDSDATIFKAFNAFDTGINIGAGYQYNQFLIRAQYAIGFTNMTPKISDTPDFNRDDYKYTNKGFSINIIYIFNK
jgi:hypothetical protein